MGTISKIASVALAGLPAVAAAQSVTLHFDADGDPFSATEVVCGPNCAGSWTVFASFTGFDEPGAYFGGFVGDFRGIGDATLFDLENLMDGEGTTPSANGGSIEGVNIFNAALLGTNDPRNPIPIFSFVTRFTTQEIGYDAIGRATVYADDGVLTVPTEFFEFNVISDRVGPFPTPGVLAVLGFGGVIGARRGRN